MRTVVLVFSLGLLIAMVPVGGSTEQAEEGVRMSSGPGVALDGMKLARKTVCCYPIKADENWCEVMPRFRCYRLRGWMVEDCFECPGFFDEIEDD